MDYDKTREEEKWERLLEGMPLWTSAKVRCTHCGHIQTSVYLHYLKVLECSKCHRMEARPYNDDETEPC